MGASIGDPPAGLAPGLKAYLDTLAEKVSIIDADRGSPLSSKPTFQDLIDVGLINATQSQALKSNGKSFKIDGKTSMWVQSAMPKYFTDLLLPPIPTGLVATMDTSNIVLYWDAWNSTSYRQTLVYRSLTNDLTDAVQIGSTSGTTYVDNLPPDGSVYFYWIRNEAQNGNISEFNLLSGTTVGNVAGAPAISYSFNLTDLILQWPTPTSTLLIKFYIIKYGSTYEGGIIVGTSNTNTLRLTVDFGGTRKYWIAPVDVNGQVGLAGSIDVVVVAPNAPTASQTVQNDALVLTYSASPRSLPVSFYEVRYGASFAAGVSLMIGAGTRFEQAVNWTGNRTFWIAAYDSAGNVSMATQVVFSPGVPGAVVVTPQIIDNNVLLSWTASVSTLSIHHYIVDKNGTPIGTVQGTFDVLFESVSGTYTYGITGVDTAGNVGVRSTTSATVAQPPDFVLYSDVNSAFAGTKTTTILDAATGALIANVDDTETWATHFTSRSWSSIDDQIAAGYTGFLVGKTTGSYVETIDYGVSIASTRITMTPTQYALTGTVTITPTIETSPNNSTWTSYSGYQAVGTSFRYVRYTLAFAAAHTGTGGGTDTANILALKPLNFRLDTKEKIISGTVSAISTDTGGTTVSITGLFLDVISINVAPLGTTPLYCVYDFVDIPSPTSFKVLVFNSSGTRVSATVSYSVRGV